MKKVVRVLGSIWAFVLMLYPLNSFAAGKLVYGISADKTNLKSGDSVMVEVSVEDNPGVAFLIFEVDYDSDVFSVESKSVGNILPDNNGRPVSDDQSGTVIFSVGTDTASDNSTETGELAKIVFEVKDQVKAQDTKIEVKDRDAFNSDIVEISSTGASVTLHIDGADSPKADDSEKNNDASNAQSADESSTDANNNPDQSGEPKAAQDTDEGSNPESGQNSDGYKETKVDDSSDSNSDMKERDSQAADNGTDSHGDVADTDSDGSDDSAIVSDSVSENADVFIEADYTAKTYQNEDGKSDENSKSIIWWLIGGGAVVAAAIGGFVIVKKRR